MNYIICSVLISFLLSLLIGLLLIPLLKILKFGQNIKNEAPKSHKKKAGVPTIGGLIFILSSVLTLPFFIKQYDNEVIVVLMAFISFALIGLFDDLLKIMHKKNEGLSSMQKMLLQIFISSFFAFYIYLNPEINKDLLIPFCSFSLKLGSLYIPFILFFYLAVTNAVNFTDGLDGLAASVTLIIIVFFTIVSFALGHYKLSIFCGIVAGSLLGFLRFNSYPAKVIMGDTGSLALGGIVATVAIILNLEITIIIVGAIYVIEALSVVLQVASIRLTGKRIFTIAPIHHALELSGWHEAKIVTVFSIATALLCLIAYLSF